MMNNPDNAGTDTTPWWQAALMIRGQTEADKRNIRVVWIWSILSGLAFGGVLYVFSEHPEVRGPLAWLLAIVPVLTSTATLRACLRFIREADEFMRKVQLEGIAIGFGIGTIFCLVYFSLELLGAPRLPLIVAIVPMMFGWAFGSFIVAARHR